jgi:hypothetical protein
MKKITQSVPLGTKPEGGRKRIADTPTRNTKELLELSKYAHETWAMGENSPYTQDNYLESIQVGRFSEETESNQNGC